MGILLYLLQQLFLIFIWAWRVTRTSSVIYVKAMDLLPRKGHRHDCSKYCLPENGWPTTRLDEQYSLFQSQYTAPEADNWSDLIQSDTLRSFELEFRDTRLYVPDWHMETVGDHLPPSAEKTRFNGRIKTTEGNTKEKRKKHGLPHLCSRLLRSMTALRILWATPGTCHYLFFHFSLS